MSVQRTTNDQRPTTGIGNFSFVVRRWLLVLLLLLLTGCASRLDVYQVQHREVAGEIWGLHTAGQTFTARAPGLYRIDVFLATYARQNTGAVIFHLRRSPTDDQDLVTIPFDAAEVVDGAYRSFTFPPLLDSAGESYYFFLEAPHAQPGNAITVWYSPTDACDGGTAVLDGVPQPGDLHFRTYARYIASQVLHDTAQGLRQHWTMALLALLLFLAPGYALLTLLAPRAPFDLSERLILGAGLSVALAPLLFLFASLVGLRLGTGSVVLVIALSAGYCVLRTAYLRLGARRSTQYPIANTDYLIPALLLFITIISLAARFLVVQDLAVPMWGDSVHHTLIAQLLVDHGGLFTSWEPYVPLRTFTYHYGFHSLVALFHWLTGTPVLRSVIVVGQILNALAPLMAYPLTVRLGGGRWAGVLAVLLGSLWSPMPMTYVNWGRYTQLAGMILLAAAATLTVDVLDDKRSRAAASSKWLSGKGACDRLSEENRWSWQSGLLTAIALAGLALSHYRVAMMYAMFLLAVLPVWTFTAWRQSRPVWSPWVRMAACGLMAGVLAAPWLPRLWHGLLLKTLAKLMAGGSDVAYFRTAFNLVGDVLTYVPPHLLILAGLGAAWGLIHRQRGALVVVLWVLLLVILANPHVVGLPGTGVVNNFAILISLYLPLSVLAGDLMGALAELVSARFRGAEIALAVVILAVALAGADRRLDDLDYRYRLVTAEDLQAMSWIREHTPPDAKFLVNGFFAFGGYTVVGSDAGWWIPYLTERANTVPPVVYTLEETNDPAYVSRVAEFYQQLTSHPLDSPETLRLLASEGVTHVYIGAVGGELLDPQALQRSPAYRVVYQKDGVWIFEVESDAGSR